MFSFFIFSQLFKLTFECHWSGDWSLSSAYRKWNNLGEGPIVAEIRPSSAGIKYYFY